jgi:Ala-tRNA(Pro) deacylase
MPATRQQLTALFDQLGVAHATLDHPPVFTVAESAAVKVQMPGGHTKNLFLKDKKGALWLFCALAETQIDLNALGAGRFSFGSAALMEDRLGVTPGSVTLFAAINDPTHQVRIGLDAGLLDQATINFHPLRNDATTAISPADALRFLAHTGHAPVLVAFGPNGESRLLP